MAQGLRTYEEIKESDLVRFFKCIEIDQKKNEHGYDVYLQTGAYQEYINIILRMDEEHVIYEAELQLARSWIGDKKSLNVFANDISKSFLFELVPKSDRAVMSIISEELFHLRGTEDEESEWYKDFTKIEFPAEIVRQVFDVYTGDNKKGQLELSNSTVYLSNDTIEGIEFLLIKIQS